jgi:serine protease DegQ
MVRTRECVAPFVLGFSSCALAARFLLPLPAAATSTTAYGEFNPAVVVAKVDDAVVSLEAFETAVAAQPAGLPRLIGLSRGEEPDPSSVASGVIVSSKGYVVTNHHVVAGAAKVRVVLSDGREFDARIVGKDSYTDLAVLRIPGRNLKPAQLGDSHAVHAGDPVVAIGNPLGFENSVSVGVVSANRSGPIRIDGRTLGDLIQTDAAINQGNSGGGLFDGSGRLVGVNSAIMVPRGGSGSIGIGFAIPAHRVKPVVDTLIAKGHVPRAWLGVRYRVPQWNPFVRRPRNGVGVLVEGVVPGGPAARCGITPADIIRQLGECAIRTPDDIRTFVERYQPGERIQARVLRNGREKKVTLTLAEAPGVG